MLLGLLLIHSQLIQCSVPKVCESKNGTVSKNDELKVSESKNDTESKNDELKEAWNHCQKWSKSIEVIYENDEDQKVLAKVHFRSYPAVSGQCST